MSRPAPSTLTHEQILKRYWGYDHFRPLQREAIASIEAGRDTLVLMPTGGGKSIIYQVPTLAREGLCIVVTPLIALMKDQVDQLRRRHIIAYSIHAGCSPQEADRILDNCLFGDVKFLFIAPERILSPVFMARCGRMNISLIAVDEAHCISQWGYDFRPAYLQIAKLRELHPTVPILALTATASERVCEDILLHLHAKEANTLRMSFARENLSFLVRHTEDKYEHLMRIINNVAGSGIVYVRTRERAETVAEFLQNEGVSAESYHGGMRYKERSRKQEQWIKGTTRVMVATNAFGMGIDKADVRFVVHYNLCDSIEAYYQEAGRAGRDGKPAFAVLLTSAQDPQRAQQSLNVEFPTLEQIRTLYEGLYNHLQIGYDEGKGRRCELNPYELATKLKLFPPVLINAIKVLEINGYLAYSDEMEIPPRVQFIVQREELYRLRVMRRELDHIITVLLRLYSGIFSQLVSIDEAEIVHTSGYTPERVRELLKRLWQTHIIRYIPGSKSPMVTLLEERLRTNELLISSQSLALRREEAVLRLNAMLDYAHQSETCRSVVMQRYFSESDATACGRCDVCRAQRSRALRSTQGEHTTNVQNPLQSEIVALIGEQSLTIKELAQQIRTTPELILEQITRLLESKKIIELPSGKLEINR